MRSPIIEPMPYQCDSVGYFSKIRNMPQPVLLDSCTNLSGHGRYDIISAAPAFTITHRYNSPHTDGSTAQADPFDLIRSQLNQTKNMAAPPNNLPFIGGFIGYLGYETGMQIEEIEPTQLRQIDLPDIQLGWYEWALINDHQQQLCFLVALPGFEQQRFDHIKKQLTDDTQPDAIATTFQLSSAFVSNTPFADYATAFKKIIDYIHAGDCYQVNLSQQFSADFSGDPWGAYQLLRKATPSPYSAFMEFEGGTLLSLSPEQFIALDQKKVTTRPIKGTRRRGDSKETDRAYADALTNSDKDRSENLMIVDLLRNDLGKSCIPGSIEVPELFKLESFSNVHHLVSSITGTLCGDADSVDLLTGCFPGGSITGAPKHRAMEIIAELEPHNRSVYCGSIGYISANGDINSNIAIRTLACNQDKIYCWGGGGIVADSEVEMEYQESFDKIECLINCLPLEND